MPESFSDRHLEMADELREFLADMLPPATTMERVFAPDMDRSQLPAGRHVFVFPTTEDDVQRLARRRMMTEYTFAVEGCERYLDAAGSEVTGAVPTQWVDDCCGWWKEKIYQPLNDRVRSRELIIPTARPQTCSLELKYDPDWLRRKVFVTRVVVAFREERRA